MAYVTVDQLKQYLKQWEGHPDEDPLFADVIARAEDIVNEYLGFEFAGYDDDGVPLEAYTTATKRVKSWGTSELRLPSHEAGSITLVTYEGDTDALADYEEDAETGRLVRTFTYPSTASWPVGTYEVTANWGYGTVPEAVQQVTLELAVNIFRGRDRGMWTDVIGVEGSGGLRFTGGLTNQQRAILSAVKKRLNPGVLFA
jgi:hypothetical protein